MVFLFEVGKGGGFVYGIFIAVGEGWWFCVWHFYLSWGRVVASYMVSLLKLGKGGGFV